MRKSTKIKQHDITDCGAACLASACAHYGLLVPVARIRQYACTDKDGTNILGLVEAANKLDLVAKGVRAESEALDMVVKPAIAHVQLKQQLLHFVVIYKVSKTEVTYMDPADGEFHTVDRSVWEKEEWTNILVILEPQDGFQKRNEKTSLFQQFFDLVIPHKRVMLLAILGAIVFSVLGLSTSIYVAKIVDQILIDGDMPLLHIMSALMLILVLLRGFIGYTKSVLVLKTSQRIDSSLILGYYKHLLSLPQLFFDTMRTGEIISRVNDAVKIRNFINSILIELIVNIMVLFFATSMMFIYSWKLALMLLVSIPIFLLIYTLYNRHNKKFQRKIMESSANLESQLVESISSIKTIKSFGVEEHSNVKTEMRFVDLLRSTYATIRGAILSQESVELVSAIATVGLLWIGSLLVINREITAGTLMLFYSLIRYVIGPIGALINANASIQDALIAADRLFQIMDLEQEDSGHVYQTELKRDMIGDIRFVEASFRYGTRENIFDKLNLTIAKGKTTAIVGESGSGKSTLISLIQNLYVINKGKLYIGDLSLDQITNASLRKYIVAVPQHIELFAGNVIDNIALGDVTPDVNRVFELITLLGLDDFINKLPEGYQTYIGENGTTLSGGERQRLAIARALYKDPEVIILDEATSSLDSISEACVKGALKKLADMGKTIILIAHRLSTVQSADTILVMKDGAVMEQGTHKELLVLNGEYDRLWNEQYCVVP